MKVLITGITGFAGSHLTEYLNSLSDVEIVGLDLTPPSESFNELFGDRVPVVHICDLADARKVCRIVKEEQPGYVIHLAAKAQVAGTWERAPETLLTNIGCTQVLMQAVYEAVPEARILLISSSEVYGQVKPEKLPLNEDSALKPKNPYSVSKVAQEFVGTQYKEAFGTKVIIARPFNHIGPRQVGNFIVPAFAKQIAEIEAGKREPVLLVGNLESKRDFTDVRDIVRAYYLILTEGTAGEAYNVASGKSHKTQEILDILIELSNTSPVTKKDPEKMRRSDIPDVFGDCKKLNSLGKWQAEIPLRQSLEDTLNYWRQVVKTQE